MISVLAWAENVVGKGENYGNQHFHGFHIFKKPFSSGSLTLYHTIPTLDNLRKEPFLKLWEKEKMLVTSIFSFSHNVYYHFLNKFQFLGYICL